ncbi:MAG: ABC transporter ATP-binding protein [Selenomonadaceae bacterium]|nr:ABC transporter ATP-binding protein [Selenomonadaceae bacterium]
MFDKILRLENISVAYGAKKILQGITFSLKHGEILVIAGESGSGKSTILKAIDGLLGKGGAITDGEIFFDGKEITILSDGQRRKISGAQIGMIFQNAGASFCPIRTIGEQIFESVKAHRNWTEKEFRERAKIIMRNINLEESALDEYPFRLSGGMAQRAGILAAMILEPKLLLADEPTSALDAVTQVGVVKELLKLRARHGISIVMVTHHMGVAWYMADKILIMQGGRQVEFGTKEQIFNAPQEIYTQELIRAVPRV